MKRCAEGVATRDAFHHKGFPGGKQLTTAVVRSRWIFSLTKQSAQVPQAAADVTALGRSIVLHMCQYIPQIRRGHDPLGFIGITIAGADDLAPIHNQVVRFNGLSLKETHETIADSVGVALLGFQGCSGDVRGHRMIWHLSPRMVRWCRLGVPDIARIAGQVSLVQHLNKRVPFHYSAPGGVDQVGTFFHAV